MVAQPGRVGELDAMGLFVQGDPHPEVSGIDLQSAFHSQDRRGHQVEGRGVRERVELAQDSGAHDSQHTPDGCPAGSSGCGLERAVRDADRFGRQPPRGGDVGADDVAPVDDQFPGLAHLGQPGRLDKQVGCAAGLLT